MGAVAPPPGIFSKCQYSGKNQQIFGQEHPILSEIHLSGSIDLVSNALLKSDVTRRDYVSVVMDAGSRIVNFIVNFIHDGTVFA